MELIAPKLFREVQSIYNYEKWNNLPRPFTRMLKATFGRKLLRGCEIGYGLGENAESLITELNIENLYCVDKYFGKEPYRDAYGNNVTLYCHPDAEFYRRRTHLGNNGVSFIEADSCMAFQFLPRDLDFIYIDGNHNYDNVKQDIELSLSHVRTGGYVGGHDFGSRSFQVSEAVLKVAKEYDLEPTIEVPDFWFRKA